MDLMVKRREPKQKALRTHLISLVLGVALPTLLLASVTFVFLAYQHQRNIELSLRGTTKALATTVDERIDAVITALNILIASGVFEPESLKLAYWRSKEVVRSQEGWAALSWSLASGEQVFNTAKTFGEELHSLRNEPFFKEAVRTGNPAVSGYRIGNSTSHPLISIAVPVFTDDKVSHVLTASIKLETLSEILRSQDIPAHWTAAILDSEARIIARSRVAEEFAGRLATPVLANRIKEGTEDLFEDVTKEGVPSYGAFSRVQIADWTVALGIPAESVQFTKAQIFWTIAGIVLLLSLAIFLALLFGRRIAKPITALARAASAMGRGEPVPLIQTSVAELTAVGRALAISSRERNKNEAQLEEAIRIRDNFISIASHELKTPLTALQLNLELLRRKASSDPNIQSLVERPIRQIRRLARLVDDLLTVSRISSGRLDIHAEEVEVTSLIKQTIDQFESECERTGSSITFFNDEAMYAFWDQARVEQVLTNLISNALKYGNGQPIVVSLERRGERAVIEVRDSGVGIAKEDQERIFDRFERVGVTRNHGGLGLGLWIVKQIVQSLGGEISVESKLGEGSCFKVSLPLQVLAPKTSQLVNE